MEPELQSVIQGLQEEISRLQQQVNSQQGSSSSPNASNSSNPGTRQPKFAFAPAQLRTGDQFIDYSTKEGAKVFEDATASLSTHKFNGDKTRLPAFKADIRARATVAGWNSGNSNVMDVSVSQDGNTITRNIIDEYPLLTKDQIVSWATATFINKENRAAQNNFNMFTALENSLDLRIFKKCEIGTSATIALIRSDLQNLDKLIADYKSDIRSFNSKVKTMVQKLRCYGEPVHDLIHSLFKAYDAVKDSEFVRTIRDERKAFILGQRKDLTADGLMDLAESLYNIYVEDKSWMQHTDHQEQIIALQAEIKTLKSNRGTSSRGSNEKNSNRNRGNGKNGRKGKDRILVS